MTARGSRACSNETDCCVELLRRLVAIQSLPGREAALAEQVAREMSNLGFDHVEVDEAGNVLGLVRGRGEAPPLMFNTHLDHVDVGDPASWPYPPFAAHYEAGRVWGRGTVDIKGPMAAQLVAAGRLAAERPPGDVWVTAVVQEEIGGVGARALAARSPASLLIVGEPSGNQIRRGHRGRVALEARFRGRSCHASVPDRGVNPLYGLALFLDLLRRLALPTDAELGRSTAAPTLLRTDQTSANVVPAEVWQTIDYRCIPGESASTITALLRPLVERAAAEVEGLEGSIEVPSSRQVAYTGFALDMPADNPAYLLDPTLREVDQAREIVADVLDEDRGTGVWRFATDGGHFAKAGLLPIGFGPGDDLLAHTTLEQIEVAELMQAVAGNEALARRLPKSVGSA